MSDYVANLIQRQIGTAAESLRPIAAPVYLPVSPDAVEMRANDTLVTLNEQEGAATSVRQENGDSMNGSSLNDIHESSRETIVTAKDQAVREATGIHTRGENATDISTPKRIGIGEIPDVMRSFPSRVVARRRSEARPGASQFEMTKSLNVSNVDRDEKESVIIAPAIKSTPLPALSQAGKAEAIDKGTIKPRQELLRLRSTSEQEMPPAGRINATKPETTIRVSIGRIEVRAITPPTTPRKTPAPARSRMTLEDYLRQRQGGQQ